MKRKIFLPSLLLMLVAAIAWAADATYQAKVYMKQGAEEQVVADGGAITVESGGKITFGGVDLTSGTDVITTNAGTQTLTNKTLTTPAFTLGAAAKELLEIGQTWTLNAAEAICTLLSITSGSSDATIIAPNTTGRLYVLRNASAVTATIKISGGTGVSVASGKTAVVIHNGSDYVRVTADATH